MTLLLAAAPIAAMAGGALLILLAEAVFPARSGRVAGPLAAAAFGAAVVTGTLPWDRSGPVLAGALDPDHRAILFIGIIAAAGLLAVLAGLGHIDRRSIDPGPYHALLLLASSGAAIMVSSPDLLVVLLGLELLSVSGYALAGIDRSDPRSTEAAVKSFMMGSLASAFFIFGLAFLYGGSGSLRVPVATSFRGPAASLPWALPIGLGLVVVGLGFKIALVPFHMWAPDVYEGAPTPVTAYLTVVPKAAGFAVLLRLVGGPEPGPEGLRSALAAVAVLTMVVASVAAVRQRNVKRLLAYSSIAHSGTILIAVVSGAGSPLAFYLAVYLLMNIGAFGAVMALAAGDGRLDLDDLAGASRRSPALAAMLAVLLLSLAGFPPTGGFLAKFFVFAAAVDRGLVGLVVVAVLASLLSVYYYLRVIVAMYMKEDAPGAETGTEPPPPALALVIFLCAAAVLQLGLAPGNLLDLIRGAF